jgi:hypothetical protein
MNSPEAKAAPLRNWMTAAEFLAAVEAHRAAKLKERQKPRQPFVPGPFVRTYVLDPNHKFRPRPIIASQPKPEVTP